MVSSESQFVMRKLMTRVFYQMVVRAAGIRWPQELSKTSISAPDMLQSELSNEMNQQEHR